MQQGARVSREGIKIPAPTGFEPVTTWISPYERLIEGETA